MSFLLDTNICSAHMKGKPDLTRGILQRSGIVVQPVDLLIASVALANNLVLVTHNSTHFHHIPGLRLDDWLTP